MSYLILLCRRKDALQARSKTKMDNLKAKREKKLLGRGSKPGKAAGGAAA
jgi:hypothetical protein